MYVVIAFVQCLHHIFCGFLSNSRLWTINKHNCELLELHECIRYIHQTCSLPLVVTTFPQRFTQPGYAHKCVYSLRDPLTTDSQFKNAMTLSHFQGDLTTSHQVPYQSKVLTAKKEFRSIYGFACLHFLFVQNLLVKL